MQTNPYYSLNEFLRMRHGEKVLKLSIDAGFTCPNRDGTISHQGCLFCSERGSGDFTFYKAGSITKQLKEASQLLEKKWGRHHKYIAYFQAFTNTYDTLDILKQKYEEALDFPNVVGIAIATRPDCLTPEIVAYLHHLNQRTHLWIELGLQTIHESTALLINRGYDLSCFERAITLLNNYDIETVVHLILGLPHESKADMLKSAQYVSNLPLQGIKLHMLHILDNAPLGRYYTDSPFPLLTETEYITLIGEIIALLPPHFVIHRLTGDGAKEHLIAPSWTLNKRQVLNHITHYLKDNHITQGKALIKTLSLNAF